MFDSFFQIHCDSCGKSFHQLEGKLFERGVFICNHCLKTEVNEANIDKVVRDVIKLLNRVGFEDIIYDNFNYKIVSRQEMAKLANDENVVGLHSIETCMISERGISNVKETIYIIDHLTEIVFRANIAHEILHSWQTRNCLRERFSNDEESNKRVEGFAQMGSYLVYKDLLNHRKSKYVESRIKQILEWDNPYYGKAFKSIYQQFQGYPGTDLQKWYYIIKCARQNKLHVD